MSLLESGESTGEVSLVGLFEGKFRPCGANPDILSLARACVRGGWPELVDVDPADAQVVIGEYLSAIFGQSIPRMGGDTTIAERSATSVARNLGQSVTLGTYARDVYARDDAHGSSNDEQQSVSRHLALLERAYLVDAVAGWVPPSRSPKRMRTKPKRYLADPSLAVSLLGLSVESLLQDWQTFGLVFENLCMRDVDVYARAVPGARFSPVRYYRDDSGLEVDVIIELSDGRWAALEVKTSEEKVDDGLATLRRLKRKLTANPASRVRPPEFVAVVVCISEFAREVGEYEYVLPIRCLGA
jgi:predicted AAA+ superfamily ATPase